MQNNSDGSDCRTEIGEQWAAPPRRTPKRCGTKYILSILLSAVFLLAVLSAHFFMKSEKICLDADGEYTILNLPSVHCLFYSTMRGIPAFRCIDARNDSPIEISAMTFSNRKYMALIFAHGVKIYDHGDDVSGYENENQMETISGCVADYDSDGNDDLFLLLKRQGQKYGERLVILNCNGLKTEKTYDTSFQKVNPWKVQVCDVDGDGKKEVSLGVYTMAKYHPVYAKRPFLYEFSNHRLYPKWLGSRLSRPFDDYIFCDVDGDRMDELISIETTREGKKELNAYKWTGFGFESIGVSQMYDTIYNIRAVRGSVTAVCGSQTKAKPKTFTYRNEKIVAGG